MNDISPDNNIVKLRPFSPDIISSRMREVLSGNNCRNGEIDIIIDYLLENAGKMLRPRMVFLAASIYPHDPEIVQDAAVAIELIHMASLVHDDVIDRAAMRRGKKSLNSRWGNHASVLTGDFLFATAFKLINSHGMQAIMENVTYTIQTMCAGEIEQMAWAFNPNITEADYFKKTYGKTACLFASSCRVGALASHASPESAYALEQFGLGLGYAYQIIDDLLDFLSDSTRLGKPCGSDLLEGNITLPVIYALKTEEYGPWLRALLESGHLNAQQVHKVKRVLLECEAVKYSLEWAKKYLAGSFAYLETLPLCPALQELQALGTFILEGYYQALSQSDSSSIKEVVK